MLVKLMLDMLIVILICLGLGGIWLFVMNFNVCKFFGLWICICILLWLGFKIVVCCFLWFSGLGVKWVIYQLLFCQVVLFFFDLFSSCWVICLMFVCLFILIKVVCSIGCLLLIICSRLCRLVCFRLVFFFELCGFIIWVCLVIMNKCGSLFLNLVSFWVI